MSSKLINLDALLQIGTEGAATEVVRGRKHKHPQGWEPGITLGATGGTITTNPVTADAAPGEADWDQILNELLPPTVDRAGLAIDTKSPVEMRAWDAPNGEGGTQRMYYFKARIVRRGADEVAGPDISDLINAIKKTKVKAPTLSNAEDRAYFLQITDLQAGQADGDGIEGMARRALELSALAKQDIKALAKSGRPVSQIFVPITGDLVEGVTGWYEMQTFSVQLDRREQVKLVRRLLTEILADLASLGLPVHVAVVPGNHGENRQNGKAYTTLGDNDDVAVVEQIAEAFAFAEKFDHVTFSFPGAERLHLTVEVLGHIIGLTHGHVARGGNSPEGKILNWFKNMSVARDPIGDADILFTGHYHSGKWSQLVGDTEWIQGGALCDASAWFSQANGLVSDPLIMKGTITRDQKVEAFLPYRWARTKSNTRIA